jgi:hypothetical protein
MTAVLHLQRLQVRGLREREAVANSSVSICCGSR